MVCWPYFYCDEIITHFIIEIFVYWLVLMEIDKIKLFRYLVAKEELHLKVNSDTLSMSPFIFQGDYIFLHRYDSVPRRGDIILVSFREEKYLVCHRVVDDGHIIYR